MRVRFPSSAPSHQRWRTLRLLVEPDHKSIRAIAFGDRFNRTRGGPSATRSWAKSGCRKTSLCRMASGQLLELQQRTRRAHRVQERGVAPVARERVTGEEGGQPGRSYPAPTSWSDRRPGRSPALPAASTAGSGPWPYQCTAIRIVPGAVPSSECGFINIALEKFRFCCLTEAHRDTEELDR